MKNFSRIVSLLAALTVVIACKPQAQTGQPSAPAAAPQPSATAPGASAAPAATGESLVMAKVNGQPVTDAEVTERVKNRLKKLESQIFDIKMSGLGDVIGEKLLAGEAEKRKVSVDELVKAEVDKKIEEPSNEEVQTFYNMFKKRLGDQPLEQVKERLIAQIKESKRDALYNTFLDNLEKAANVEILVDRPRAEVSKDDDPSKGKEEAKITLIEFSDFQCPFCKKARPTVNKILETYGKDVFYVFRDFPLSFHKNAQKAAEASQCAGDQGKYWEYNTILWEKQSELEVDKLKEYSKTLGLNAGKFNECLDSGKYAKEVEKDANDGAAAGVSGTPAYFINGIFVSGAQPFENFQEIIDQDLKRKK